MVSAINANQLPQLLTKTGGAMSRNASMTADYLRSILNYSPETGLFTWRYVGCRGKSWNGRYAGKAAGYVHRRVGRRQICIDGYEYFSYRLAWLYMTGKWPSDQVDHIDGDKLNDRFSNLRECCQSENNMNRSLQSNNSTGSKGIWCNLRTKKWRARIYAYGKEMHLGIFETKEDAQAAYSSAAQRIHGEFARQI